MRHKLLCKDCSEEIFADMNMVMIKDELWEKVCDNWLDALCDKCIEKRLKRKITKKDFKPFDINSNEIIPCNAMWFDYKNNYK